MKKHYKWTWGDRPPTLQRHSEVKHALLREYLIEYFVTLVASPHQDKIQITIVDGFCGGGWYVRERGDEAPGSPIVILQAVAEAKARVEFEQQRRKAIDFDVHLVCIDEDPSAVDHLRRLLEDQGYGNKLLDGSVKLLAGAFHSHSNEVIDYCKRRSPRSGRAIFVLDQYGYDQVPASALRLIFRSLERAEVILTFNVDSLINFISQKNAVDFERKIGLDGVLTATDLDAANRSPGWRRGIQSKLYQRLTEESGARWFTTFFIRPERGHGDFWLLHLSQHWKARDVMAEAHWKYNNHFVHYGLPGFDMFSTGYATRIDPQGGAQAAFEFDNAAANASNSAMRLQIPEALSARRDGVSFSDFFLERMNLTPATRRMVEGTVLELVRDRQIEVLGADGVLRNVRKAIKADHILRLPSQRSFLLRS